MLSLLARLHCRNRECVMFFVFFCGMSSPNPQLWGCGAGVEEEMNHPLLSADDLACPVDCTATCDRDDLAFVAFRMFRLAEPLDVVQYVASSLFVKSGEILGGG